MEQGENCVLPQISEKFKWPLFAACWDSSVVSLRLSVADNIKGICIYFHVSGFFSLMLRQHQRLDLAWALQTLPSTRL